MLALLSDLHFCDETAVERNVAPAAFVNALDAVYEMALDLHAARKSEIPLDVVFLGDIFDLLRTERWFQQGDRAIPLEERPWASRDALGVTPPPAKALAHARTILEAAIAANQKALDALTARRPELEGKVRVRRFLLAGNHDRLSLHDDALHVRMRQALGAVDERTAGVPGMSTHTVLRPDHGLLARHGHELDAWNFRGWQEEPPAEGYRDEDYLPAPIGDPITTEIAARLPFLMRVNLRATGKFSAEDVAGIHARLQGIEDVRPVVTALQWAFQEVVEVGRRLEGAKNGALLDALDASVRTIVEDLKALDFYGAWKKEHHFGSGDPQAIFRDLLEVLSLFRARTVADLAPHLEKLSERVLGSVGKDGYRKGAGAEKLDRLMPGGLRHVVYGHTHEAAFAALHATPAAVDTYLNTGTFRRRIFHTDDHKGFARAELMTYLCFFTAAEAKDGWRGEGPAYTAWTGTRTPG